MPRPSLKSIEPVVRCEAFKEVSLDAVTGAATQISSASTVFCTHAYGQISGTVSPAAGFEVRLPLTHLTKRYVQAGFGGSCGDIDIRLDNAGRCVPLQNGEVALASSDMGHGDGGMDGAWGRDNCEAQLDFAYRGST